jgi:two-component system, chemotaxis family, protein-glutamate methylesterase/glutaminase
LAIAPQAKGRDIIVIGASAGGVQALCDVVECLPPGLPAAVFIVLHISPHGRSMLPAILARSSCLPAMHPSNGEKIQPGRIYVAPPDRHLAIQDSRVHLSRNATENGHRPAIDVLFRSAARAYGSRVVGVVLTGNLDDGTAGLAAIKRCGGVAVVQDPREADYPAMPESAIANVEVDHIVPVAEIGSLLDRLLREPRPTAEVDCDPIVEEEPDAMGTGREDIGGAIESGKPSALTCPDCGGTLFEKPSEPLLHFRCRTGHAYSPESLLAKQSEALEAALWAALRSLEENAALARRMEKRAGEQGSRHSSQRHHQRAADAEKHARILREMLEHGGADLEAEEVEA